VGLAVVVSVVLIAQVALAGGGTGGGSQATVSIGKKKLKNLIASEVAKQVAKATGPPGPQGLQGPLGLQGQQGIQGRPGISGLQKVIGTSADNSNSGKFVTATCPGNKRAIGSGGQVGGLSGAFPNELANVVITFLEPSDENTVPGSVTAFAYEVQPIATNWFMQVTALCANVS
jgi:hypothetical protein